MAFSYTYPLQSVDYDGGTTTSSITIKSSNGYSGTPVDASSSNINDRTFLLAINYGTTCNGVNGSLSSTYAHVNQGGGLVGISLEHMGSITITAGRNVENQFYGAKLNTAGTASEMVPAWGGTTSAINRDARGIIVDSAEYTSGTASGTFTNQALFNLNINLGGASKPVQHVLYPSWSAWYRFTASLVIDTDLPIFSTDAELLAWINDPTSADTISHMLNPPVSPAEKYDAMKNAWYIKNIVGHNTQSMTNYSYGVNYRFKPHDGKISLIVTEPTENNPFTRRLYGYSGYTAYTAPIWADTDDDFYETENINTNFLSESIAFDNNNYYTKFIYDTNLPLWASEEDAEKWANDEIDITEALNYDELIRKINDIVRPPWGDTDNGDDIGTNGQSFVNGVRLWVMGSGDVDDFFRDIFDENYIDNILQGTQLFGANNINSILGLAYYPCQISEVATVDGSSHNINVGSWETPTATGQYVRNNNKMITCGSFYMSRVYNDFRDYEIQLYVQLPYCGQHKLEVARYLGKTVTVKYAVDITTGSCTAFIYSNIANGGGLVCMDSFDGYMASQRPIQAIDQTTYLSNVLGAVSNVGGNIASPITGKIDTAVQGVTGNVGGAISSGIMSTLGTPVDIAKTGFSLYQAKQAINDIPMSTRGGFAGCLGFFGNQQVRFITATPRSYKPSNMLTLIGAPSTTGANVGAFSGYLQCSAFQLANGFTGTSAEETEINTLMSQGVYVN